MTVRIDVSGGAQLREVSRRFAAAGRGGIRLELQKAIRMNVEPLVPEVRAAALALPSSGRYGTGLRRQLAASVQFDPGTDLPSIGINWGRLPRGTEGLAAAMDKTRFRHPVFGHADRWVSQKSRPWFKKVIKAREAHLAAGVANSLSRAVAELDR